MLLGVHLRQGSLKTVRTPYAFTDTEGHCGTLFLAQRWVITPMAGAIHNDRLLRGVFSKDLERRRLMKIPFAVVMHPTSRSRAMGLAASHLVHETTQ